MLRARGFDTGDTDGVIGPNTIAAIRAFQQSRGLTPDGFASAALLQRLPGIPEARGKVFEFLKDTFNYCFFLFFN
jgi:peptidoglycan hydrolase-like protein with peptidoglycan-binding domain